MQLIKAAETVDKCVERVVTAALDNDYTVFLTADHGNADYMINEDGTPNTRTFAEPGAPILLLIMNGMEKFIPVNWVILHRPCLNLMGYEIPTGNDG